MGAPSGRREGRSRDPTVGPGEVSVVEESIGVGASSAARWASGIARRWLRLRERAEAGMSTAEYAVGTIAACAFAAVLYKVVTGGSIVTALGHLIARALATLA
jgi:hypothetical protein